jgi:elongation factor G
VLEPIVDLAVTAPEAHMGDITGGLAAKRARINGTDAAREGEILIRAQVPLSELTRLRRRAQGRHRRARALRPGVQPLRAGAAAVQRQLVEAYKPHHDED